MTVLEVIGVAVMAVGAGFCVLAAWGVVDFPSPISRMHAATKSASLGLALLALGSGVASGSWGLTGIGVLVAVFLFVTAPISGHLLGRAAYLAGQAGHLVHDDLAGLDAQPIEPRSVPGGRFSWLRWAGLVVVWMLLWRDVSVGTLVGGSVVAAVVEAVRRTRPRVTRIDPLGLVVFIARYLGMVVGSNLRVAWEVITPSNELIREAIVAVPLRTRSLPVALLVANAISYTPGSLTVEMHGDPLVIHVHVLHFSSVEDVRAQVAEVESLAERALREAATV
jgi:monovalent cation/proton antiporter MnhG/PhaG subunit